MPRIVLEKRFLSKFDERIKIKWDLRKRGEIGIGITNCCNLKCFSCVSLCDTPMGSNTFRKEPYELSPLSLDLFLQGMKGYIPKRWVTFTGGEPTVIKPSHLEKLASIAHKNDRKILLITNGFRVDKLDPFKFDYIRMDGHGDLNKCDIERSVDYLENNGYKFYEVMETLIHDDFHEAIKERFVTDGLKCDIWLGISLWGETVFPCCCLAQMDGFYNTTKIKDAMHEAGWNVHNKDLKNTIEHWMETVPSEVIKMCALYCWRFREEYSSHPVSYSRANSEFG